MPDHFVESCLLFTVELVEESASLSRDPEFALLTARLLGEMRKRYAHICKNTRRTKTFRNELEKSVISIRAGSIPPENIYGEVQPLFEAALLLCKEASKAEGTQHRSAVQEEAERYFEQSKEWHRGDGRLVSTYYYEVLEEDGV